MMQLTAKAHWPAEETVQNETALIRVAVQPARPRLQPIQKLSILTFESDGTSTFRRFTSAKNNIICL